MAVNNEIYLRAEGITKRFGDVECFPVSHIGTPKLNKLAIYSWLSQ